MLNNQLFLVKKKLKAKTEISLQIRKIKPTRNKLQGGSIFFE